MKHSNLIIIGSGPGGYRAAVYAAQNGLSVTIIEAAEMGGTCLNHGCIPTKTLCRNAQILDTLKDSSIFGLKGSGYSIDYGAIRQRKEQVICQLRKGIESLMHTPGIDFIHGFASFKDPKTIVVDEELYTADNIIIATGSDSKQLPIDGINLSGVMDSTQFLDIDHIPHRLCIIGAGVIGMEIASIFNSLGSKVTVIEYLKECLPVLDSDIAKRLRQTLSKRGVDFSMQSAVKSINESLSDTYVRQLTVNYDKKGKPMIIDTDIVLVSTGRKPNVDGLNLESAGVTYSAKGIDVNSDFRTNIDGVYAVGDVNGKCMLAHAATFQGIHVINTILGKTDKIDFNIMPSAIFTNPEAASVGLSEEQLKSMNIPFKCFKGFYRSNGKALAINETEGMIKLFYNSSENGRIIGCHAFGAHSSDIVQEIAALINRKTTITELSNIIHIHPTLSEILHDMVMQ